MRRGLTLVEVLVVLAIIAVLTAMLFPVHARAREAGRKVTCCSNLRQIGVAFLTYVSDYDEFFPNTGDPYLWMGRRWRWPLQPYLAMPGRRDPLAPDDPNRSVEFAPQVLYCPSDPVAAQRWDSTSYAYCATLYYAPEQVNSMTTVDLYAGSPPPTRSQTMAAVTYPAHKVLAAEWLTNHETLSAGWWSWEGARNYLFVDGHVKYLQASHIRPAVNGWPDPNLTVGGVAGRDL